MNIVRHEFRKIVTSPALIGFGILCLAFNLLIVLTHQNPYANYVADASYKTGIRLGADFDARAESLEAGEYADRLRAETFGMTDVFEGYTTGHLAEAFAQRLGIAGMSDRLMVEKYARLQSAVDARHEAGDGMTLYLAGATYFSHQMLFRTVMGALLFQGILFAGLIMLLLLGYEHTAKTEFVVYSTKTGRRVNTAKFTAGIAAGLVAYALLAIVTLAVYINLNPIGGSWGSSVSSGFNYIRCVVGNRPFVTWGSFTVLQYLLASIGASVGVVLCFSLMAYATGLLLRNSYIAFLVFALFNFALITLPGIIFGATMPTFIIALSPIWLAVQQGMWFTDGGPNVLWAHFETVGIIGSLAVLTALCFWSSARFGRRNLL
jgi:hypothetical protein